MKKNRLRRMPTAQLDTLLQEELRKDTPDEEVVLPILEILEDREEKPQRKHSWLISAAAVAAVLVLLTAVVPRAVGANSLWDVLLHLSDSVMQFFAPGIEPRMAGSEYTFQTDNPGLQQLYDKVTELGITDPIVPMWLPEGYALTEIKHAPYENWEKITAVYKNSEKYIIITYKLSNEISSTQYEQLLNQVESYESGGYRHAIAKNNENWTAILIRTGLEGMITADLSKDDLFKAIDSIYRRN